MNISEAYGTLSLAHTASQSEIRRVYRRLALSLHPDKNPNDAEASVKFAKLCLAYEVLTNKDGTIPSVDVREQFRRDLEAKEARPDVTQKAERLRRIRQKNRDAMDALTRRWDRERLTEVKIPRLDTIEACWLFNERLTTEMKNDLKKKMKDKVRKMMEMISERLVVDLE
jgi:hypothetical protein